MSTQDEEWEDECFKVSKWGLAIREWERKRRKKVEQGPVRCSVVMSTYNKPELLARTLDSIERQHVPFRYEVIVVDDGGEGDETRLACEGRTYVWYYRIEREPGYRNPGFARNLGYKYAKGSVIIAQSDDVVHDAFDSINRLVKELKENEFHIATVYNAKFSRFGTMMRKGRVFTSKEDARPLFFLGSLWRKDLYAIGGNDEDFCEPGYDDDWFTTALMKRGIKCVFRDDVVGFHQHHGRPSKRRLTQYYTRMQAIYDAKVEAAEKSGVWCAAAGPWSYVDGQNYFETQLPEHRVPEP